MYFNNTRIGVKNFKEWMSKHLDNEANLYIDDSNPNWVYGIAKSPNEEFNAVSVTSTVSTYRGGTHVNYLSLNISKAIADSFSKKIKANWADVKNKLMLFVVCRIPNPMFDSQTKEYLTNTINKECLGDFKISESFIKKVMKSDIVESILAAIEKKEDAELKKLQKQQQKLKIDKLIDATDSQRADTQLFIFEGDSAGESSRNFRDSKKQGIFKLKGKFMNVSKMNDKQILVDKNGSPTEAAKLMSALGLTLNGKVKKEDLRYMEILIATDMDTDGDSITGLLLNFFSKWKELFDMGMIYRVMTPLLVIKKGKNVKYFYTNEEWLDFQAKNTLSGYDIEYKKGLGSLEDTEYQEMIQNPRKIKFTLDENSKTLLDAWFGEDVEKRKKLL
jgi:DNA topoisomerase-2